jgi:hypothetical protein
VTGGIVGSGDLTISAGGGMSINIAVGEVVVPGSSAATQSGYVGRVSSTTNLAISASDPTNPRIDRVSALITDSAYSGGTNTFTVAVETGTPTSGATLSNLNGVAAAPTSSYTLGYVLVPAGSASVTGGNISNVSALAAGSVPPLAFINATGSTTAAPGQWLETAAGQTITLPAPTKNAIVAVTAASGVSGSSQVTVAAGSTGAIYGVGLSAAASFKLGTVGASVILEADGTNWYTVAGQVDTGWVALTLGSNITTSTLTNLAAVRQVGTQIFVRGQLQATASITHGTTLATMPASITVAAEARPLIGTYCAGNTGGAFCSLLLSAQNIQATTQDLVNVDAIYLNATLWTA